VTGGLSTPACKLAEKLTSLIVSENKGAESAVISPVEKDVAKLVIAGKEASKNGKEPKNADGFKNAIKDLKVSLGKFLDAKAPKS